MNTASRFLHISYKLSLLIPLLILIANRSSSQQNNVRSYSHLRMFTKNIGQWNPTVRYSTILGKDKLTLLKNGMDFHHDPERLKKPEISFKNIEIPEKELICIGYQFINPNKKMRIVEENRLQTVSHFYKGNNTKWKTSLPNFKKIVYQEVWKKIDIEYSAQDNCYSQTLIVHPGGKLSDAKFASMNSGSHHIDDTFASIEANVNTKTGLESIPVVMTKRSNTLGFTTGVNTSSSTLRIHIKFSTYLGGNNWEDASKILVDRFGNVYVFGCTISPNFPSMNSMHKYNGDRDAFLCKYSCDGKELIFSAIIGGERDELSHDMSLGQGDNTIYLLGSTRSASFPVYGKARSKSLDDRYKDNVVIHISNTGLIIGSGYFGLHGNLTPEWYWQLAADPARDVVWLFGEASPPANVPYISQDAFIKDPPGARDCILTKLNNDCDSILYATYIGGSDNDHPSDLSIDHFGNPIILGVTSSTNYPIKNAFQPTFLGLAAYFITKFQSTAKNILYSTYFGNPPSGSGIHSYNDAKNNCYIACIVNGSFPLTTILDSTPVFSSKGIGIGKFTQNGDNVFTTFFGKLGGISSTLGSITADSCENIYISGWTDNQSFPLKDPFQRITIDSLNALPVNFLSVINPTGEHLLYSTHWGYLGTYQIRTEGLAFDRAQYLYLSNNTNGDIPVYKAFQMQMDLNPDAFLSRLHFDFCNPNYMQCTINCVDSVRVETAHHAVVPERFPITVPITNNDQLRTARLVEGELVLPPGLVLVPSSQSSNKMLSPSSLGPGQTGALTWFVRVDTTAIQNASLPVKVVVSYSDSSLMDAPCLQLSSYCEKDIPVKYYQEIIPLSCSLSGINQLTTDSSKSSYIPDTFKLNYTLQNFGSKTAKLRYVELKLPDGFETMPLGDERKVVTEIPDAGSVDLQWTIHPIGTRWQRNAIFTVVAIDTNGFEQSRCDKSIFFPAIKREMDCVPSVVDTLKYNKITDSYSPSTFIALLKLKNKIDTVQSDVTSEIDLSRSKYLALASNETVRKQYASVAAYQTGNFSWSLHTTGKPPTTITDTLIFRYRTAFDTMWRECMHIVVIEKADFPVLVACNLTAPDSLFVSGQKYLNNPFAVSYSLKNVGVVQAPVGSVELVVSEGARVVQGSGIGGRGLDAGDSLSASWNVRVLSSRYDREIVVRVIAKDSSGQVMSVCDRKVFVPAIDASSCSVTSLDTVRWNKAQQRYEPQSFPLSLEIKNGLDTAEVMVQTEIDLSAASHFTTTDQLQRIIPVIDSAGSKSIAWTINVTGTSNSDRTETIVVRYRLQNETRWRECVRMIFIEAEKKIARAACASAGNDSLWYDLAWERYIPNPLLVRYTLTNTGTMTLSACSIAIVVPPQFMLVNPQDSIQAFSPLVPSQSKSFYWQLKPSSEDPMDTTARITWKWTCNELASDTACVHDVAITTKQTNGLVVTPWLLRFKAKQNDVLPPSQQVTLINAQRQTMSWSATTSLPWLNIGPTSGTNAGIIDVQPNTTNLVLGTHTGSMNILSPQSPSRTIGIEYEIYLPTEVRNPKSEVNFELGQNYPNPWNDKTVIQLTWCSDVILSQERHSVRSLKVFDLFGREVLDLTREADRQSPITVKNSQLPGSGIYFYRAIVGVEQQTRMMILK